MQTFHYLYLKCHTSWICQNALFRRMIIMQVLEDFEVFQDKLVPRVTILPVLRDYRKCKEAENKE